MNAAEIPAVMIYGVLAIIGAFWTFFPLLIWSQLRQVIKLLKSIRDSGDQVADQTKPQGQANRISSSVKYGA